MQYKNVSFRVNSAIYDEYKWMSKLKGLHMSRQIEMMMETQLEENAKSLKGSKKKVI